VRQGSPPDDQPSLEQLLRLYVSGSSEKELADMIGVHPARMPAILNLALEDLEERSLKRAENAIQTKLELALELIDSEIARNVLIVLERCPTCGGDEQARISCPRCKGTGRRYGPVRKLAAIRRLDRLARRRIKLLGLDEASPRPAFDSLPTSRWPIPLEHLSKEQLEEERTMVERFRKDKGPR
jgi:hypothetical protein